MTRSFVESKRNWVDADNEGGVLTDDVLHPRQAAVEQTERIGLLDVDRTGTGGASPSTQRPAQAWNESL